MGRRRFTIDITSSKPHVQTALAIANLYNLECCDEHKIIHLSDTKTEYEQWVEYTNNRIARLVFDAGYNLPLLDEESVKHNAERIFTAVKTGYSIGDGKIGAKDKKQLEELRKEVYVFSGFKSENELRQIGSLLKDDKGNIRSFNDFKADVKAIRSNYNVNYLDAEYHQALRSSEMVSKWNNIQADKEALPFLQYDTAGDSRVRAAHRELNGVIRRVDDPFWRTHYPPNGWRCRCSVRQLADADEADLVKPYQDIKIAPMFKNNVGINGNVFPDTHPYFDIAKERAAKVKAEALALVTNEKVSKTEYKPLQQYDNGGNLQIHETHQPQEIEENTFFGTILAKNGYEVKLLDYQKYRKNPDASINGVVSDFKKPQKDAKSPQSGIEDSIRNANKQLASIVVIYLENPDLKKQSIYNALRGVIKSEWNKSIKEVWLIDTEEKIYKIQRSDIESNSFSDQLPDL